MNKIPANMQGYINEHHVLSLSTVNEKNLPASCSVFYVFVQEENSFVFASDYETEHIKNILQNPDVSGTIHNETKEIAQIRGLQIKGMVTTAEARHEHLYLKTYPYAKDIDNKSMWKLKITELKYTDNSLGFGQKEDWKY